MDVGLHGVGREGNAIRPGVVEQLVARQNLTGPAQQALQDGELALAQVDRPARNRDPAGGLVELDRAGLERVRLPRRRTATQGPQSSQQLLVGERLDQIVVRPGIQALDSIADRVASREHQDRHLRALLSKGPSHVESRPVRQPDVEDDRVQLEGVGGCGLQPVLGRQGRLDYVAILAEKPLQETAEAGIVLYDEQMHD